MIEIENLHIQKKTGFKLQVPHLLFQSHKIHFVVGPNGAGKTTLLRAIAGIDRTYTGSILMNGNVAQLIRNSQRAQETGWSPGPASTDFDLTVFQYTLMGRYPLTGNRPTEADRNAAELILNELGLSAFRNRKILQLSRGQAQLVELARSLVHHPRYIVFDEPFANLDLHRIKCVIQLLRQRCSEGATAIVTVHDINLAVQLTEMLYLVVQQTVKQVRSSEIAQLEALADWMGRFMIVREAELSALAYLDLP